MCCHDVLIDNVFMRNSDDCIALYNHRWNWWGGSDNITVQNSILWADIAHPINVGGHGDPESLIGETIENLIFGILIFWNMMKMMCLIRDVWL